MRGKRNEVSERVLSARGDQGLGQGWACGGQFLSVSGHPVHHGMRIENGLGQVSRGANPLEPRQVGVNATKQARELHPPEAINDWARGDIANRLVGPA